MVTLLPTFFFSFINFFRLQLIFAISLSLLCYWIAAREEISEINIKRKIKKANRKEIELEKEKIMTDSIEKTNDFARDLMKILAYLIRMMENDQREKEEAIVTEIDYKIQKERKEIEKREEEEIAEYKRDQFEYEEYQNGLLEAFIDEDSAIKEEERIQKERIDREKEKRCKEEAEKKRDVARRQNRDKMKKEKASARAARNNAL